MEDPLNKKNKASSHIDKIVEEKQKNNTLAEAFGGWQMVTSVRVIGRNDRPVTAAQE